MSKKTDLTIRLRPCKDGEYYRFRLLNFYQKSKNDRDYPFIEKWVHEIWSTDENGRRRLTDTITCPVTKYAHFDGDPYKECPICNYAGVNFNVFRESGKKDKIAAENSRLFKRQYRVYIPVYVVKDPNYPLNEGKCRVICFTDKEKYKEFDALVRRELSKHTVFNAKNAVDFYISMKSEKFVYGEGTPNAHEYTKTSIDKWGFSNKPYDIAKITKEMIDEFEFDDIYYTPTNREMLAEFYKKHCVTAAADIPTDDIDIGEDIKAAPAPKAAEISASIAPVPEAADTKKIDDLTEDIDNLDVTPSTAPAPTPSSEPSLDDIDALLDTI